jgi:hypothetical protein
VTDVYCLSWVHSSILGEVLSLSCWINTQFSTYRKVQTRCNVWRSFTQFLWSSTLLTRLTESFRAIFRKIITIINSQRSDVLLLVNAFADTCAMKWIQGVEFSSITRTRIDQSVEWNANKFGLEISFWSPSLKE